MPRQSSRRPTQRVQTDTAIAKPASPQASYPSYVNYHHVRTDRSAGAAELRMSEALQGFGRSLNQAAVKTHAEGEKRRRLRGQADALKTGAPEDWGAWREEVLADPERGDAYMQAYGTQAAKLAAVNKTAEMSDELAAREDIMDEASFNKWYAENTQKDIEVFSQLDDMPEAQVQYLAAMEAAELDMRSIVKKRQADFIYGETERDFNMVARSELEMVNKRGAAPGELNAWFMQKQMEGRQLGLKSDDINEGIIRQVGEMAVDLGEPEALDMFLEDHPDVAGEGTVPGLAHSNKWGPIIRDFRKKAVKERDASANEFLKAQEKEWQDGVYDAIREGNTEQALAMIEEGYGMDPAGRAKTAVSMRKEALQVDKKEARIARNVAKLSSGDTLSVPPAERKEAMGSYHDRMVERAGATGNPEALWEAKKDVARTGGQLGQMAPQDEAKLSELNMLDSEAMAEQISIFNMYKGVSPALLNNMSTDSRDKFDRANRMLQGGIKQDQVMIRMQELEQPEVKERLKKMAATDEWKEDARNIADSIEARKGFFNDIELEDLATSDRDREWVRKRAMEYAARTGAEMEEAMDVASQQWQQGFGVIEMPDGSFSSFYKGNGMPANIEDMIQWGSDGITEELADENEPDAYWMLQPDPATMDTMDPQFIVRDQHGRMQTEVRGGLTVPMTVGLGELKTRWNAHMTSETEEEQRMQQEERAKGYTDPYRNLEDDYMPPYYDQMNQPPAEDMPADMPPAPPGPYGGKTSLGPTLDKAMDMVMKFEGFRDSPYYATDYEKKQGIQTIGYGRTTNVVAGNVVSEAEEQKWLAGQLADTEEALERTVGPRWNKLTDNQRAAVISLAYNVDKDVQGQLFTSKALAALKRGDFARFKKEAFDENIGFTKQDGKVLRGLVKRRNEELAIFDTLETASQ